MLLAWNLRIQRRKRRLLFSFVWRSRFGREDWRRVCRCWSIVDLQKRCSEFDMQQRAEGLSCRTFSCEAVLYRPWWLSRSVSMSQNQSTLEVALFIAWNHRKMAVRCSRRVALLCCCFAWQVFETASSVADPPPSLDDLWSGRAYFQPYVSHDIHSAGFEGVDAGTRVVVRNGTWYLFGRNDTGPTSQCPQGEISINVRASVDKGLTWGTPVVIVPANPAVSCLYADGTAFFDEDTGTWHYLSQALQKNWNLAHFYLPPQPSDPTASPLSTAWVPNPANPVVTGGQLFAQICNGTGKHCPSGMQDEGTPEIVAKSGGDFYVTFHGYDYKTRAAARGVARTPDFVNWSVTGGTPALPGDVIFAAEDCSSWNVSWAAGGCIGSGEASILTSPSGYMYQVIEATDVELTCDLQWGMQWWPLGLVRSKTWAASPQWEQMPTTQTPFVGGPAGQEPHVGCSIQYNSFHRDEVTQDVYFGFWDVSFHSANKTAPSSTWNLYKLQWGEPQLPMQWPGPAQKPVNCSTAESCKDSCTGFTQCPSDGRYYCCDAPAECSLQHACAGTPGLLDCACP